jgi:GT2 family glycosyltransferase
MSELLMTASNGPSTLEFGEAAPGAAGQSSDVCAVAIGRNEGPRLIACLRSLRASLSRVVYVDSGSTDGSIEAARRLGVEVVTLDADQPFTAARARNAGFARLLELEPTLRYVQFVDGDCEVAEDWIRVGREALEADGGLAVVCGRRREREPERTLWNGLIDVEWDAPVGPARSCGGDSLMRVEAFRQVDGFDPTLIAGEEPDLCLRLRSRGWRIERLAAEMTRHDAAMERFGQWWKRNVRAGHACAEAAARHGSTPERFKVRETWSNWTWGLIVPALALALAWPTRGLSLLLLAGYLMIAYRSARGRIRLGTPPRWAVLYGLSCAFSKFPQALGQFYFVKARLTGRSQRLIEYKGAAASG